MASIFGAGRSSPWCLESNSNLSLERGGTGRRSFQDLGRICFFSLVLGLRLGLADGRILRTNSNIISSGLVVNSPPVAE